MSKRLERALQTFHNPHSCAQAVYAAYAENPSQEAIESLKAKSGGRAEGGMCGALYAAAQFPDESRREKLFENFEKDAGSVVCKEIKRGVKTSCKDCVAIACRRLEELL